PSVYMGRITDNLASGKIFQDIALPGTLDLETDRVMVCGSQSFNKDMRALLESHGMREGSNSQPGEFVIEKAFVGDGV
ncbi:MAG: ferredoxin--NADP reductase, partial [Alphaproteobacteria bacterium]